MGMTVLPKEGWRIHNYKNPEKIIMGFEYEIACKENVARNKILKNQLPKHYSFCYEELSAGAHGYEIKSSVAPLKTLKFEISQLSDIFNWPIEHKENTGGIHVNVSRNNYTDKHYLTVFQFLHNKENFEYFLSLSKRTEKMFHMYSRQNNNTKSAYEYSLTYNEYCGIITTRKFYAYEFRMFSAQPVLLKPAVEMIHALFDIAPEFDTSNPITIDDFETHVKIYQRYKNIRQLIETH